MTVRGNDEVRDRAEIFYREPAALTPAVYKVKGKLKKIFQKLRLMYTVVCLFFLQIIEVKIFLFSYHWVCYLESGFCL